MSWHTKTFLLYACIITVVAFYEVLYTNITGLMVLWLWLTAFNLSSENHLLGIVVGCLGFVWANNMFEVSFTFVQFLYHVGLKLDHKNNKVLLKSKMSLVPV